MLPLLHLVKWRGSSSGTVMSHSLLVDFVQITIRNIFLFCFGMSLAKQLFGENINCQRDQHSIEQGYLDMKCLINGTHTNVTYDGVTLMVHQYYYQWIPIILLLMALSFHLPCRIWHKFMGYYLNELTTKVVDKKACDLVLQVVTLSKGNGLFWKTFALEFLYMWHLAFHIWILNFIFQRAWSTYHWFPNIIPALFPEEAKCFYNYFSGGLETVAKFKCLLPLNTVYRKVFWVVYATLVALIAMHIICFGYRLYQVCTVGFERINMWWCMQVATSRAQTWYAKQLLQELCREHIMASEDEKYMTMCTSRTPPHPAMEYYECYDVPQVPPRSVVKYEKCRDAPPEVPLRSPEPQSSKKPEFKSFSTDV